MKAHSHLSDDHSSSCVSRRPATGRLRGASCDARHSELPRSCANVSSCGGPGRGCGVPRGAPDPAAGAHPSRLEQTAVRGASSPFRATATTLRCGGPPRVTMDSRALQPSRHRPVRRPLRARHSRARAAWPPRRHDNVDSARHRRRHRRHCAPSPRPSRKTSSSSRSRALPSPAGMRSGRCTVTPRAWE